MGNLKTKVFSYTLSLATVVTTLFGGLSFSSTVTASAATTATTGEYNLATNIQDGVILHAFCWSFNSIKNHMKDIAAAGFSAVQTSPANACYSGNGGMQLSGNGEWYYQYQPTDWTIGNYQLGTRDEFQAMCDEAAKYGVKVIVDVVPNHTTSTISAVSANLARVGGGLGAGQLYHTEGFQAISDWNNRWDVTQHECCGCPDINTEKTAYQDYFISYLNDCVSCGASGFRYDSAKSIGLPDDGSAASNFFTQVTSSRVGSGKAIFNYGEVLQDKVDRLDAYANILGHTTASSYGERMRGWVKEGNFSVGNITDNLTSSDEHGKVDDSKLVKWVESHDNYVGGTWEQLNDTQLTLAWAALAARSDSPALFFDRPAGSSTSNEWGQNLIGPMGSTLFEDSQVAEVNKFRNAMINQSEYLRNPNGNNSVLMVERGNKGVVIINTGSTQQLSSATTLANGTYTDQVSKRTFTVSNGTITGTIDGGKVAVVYNPSTPVSSPKATISQEGGSFSNSLALTLGYTNATSGTYSIDGGTAQSYTNGQSITIGANTAVGGTVTVKLTATDGTSTDTESYTFTKIVPSIHTAAAGMASIVLPSGWSNPTAYVYDDSGSTVKTVAAWPGVAMTKNGDNIYSYTLPSGWTSAKVIFQSNGQQIPGASQPGFALTNTQAMIYKDGSWQTDPITPVSNPSVSISQEGGSFTGSLNLTLGYSNATSGTYSINGGTAQSYTNGQQITIGADAAEGSTTTVTLTATDGTTTATKTYSYTKNTTSSRVVTAGMASIQLPSGWSNPTAYVYDDSGSTVKTVAAWPGVAMTKNGDNIYSYTLPSGWTTAKVIFQSNGQQIPGASQPGFALTNTEAMIYKDGSWQNDPITATSPSVSISQEGGNFTGSLNLTLGYSNATSGTYSINGGTAQSYTNGQSITIGASAAEGSTTTVTLTATNGTATATKTYSFIKNTTSGRIVTAGMASIQLPSGWGTPNIYVYDDSGSTVKTVAAWPGVAMTKNGDNIYSYTLPSGWTTAKVIFNYNGQQIPGANQPGFVLTNTEAMIYKDGSWQNDPIS